MQRREEYASSESAQVCQRARTLGLAAYATCEALRAFLWAFAACVAAAYGIFQAGRGVSATYFFALGAAFVGHILSASAVAWLEYPYWLNVETIKETRNKISRPIWLVSFILAWEMARQTDFFTAFWAFIAARLFDSILAFYASSYAETIIRELRASWEESRGIPTERETEMETSLLPCESAPKAESVEGASKEGVCVLTLERTRDDELDRIVGTALVEFEPNGSLAVLNIAFCPPFLGKPTFEFEQVSGEEVNFKVSTIQSFGVRLEARRALDPENDEPVMIDFFAQFPSLDS